MNTSLRLLASSFILTTVALLGGRATARAQSVSPVPAPTIITSAPYTITTAGYYQLGANLNYNGTGAANDAIITVNASNVTLDLAGHYIAGPTNNAGTQLFGVYANDRANVLVQNGTIAYCYIGVNLTGSVTPGLIGSNHINARVVNVNITKCYDAAVAIYYATGAEVSNCRISAIGGTTVANTNSYGIYFQSGTGLVAAHNSIATITSLSGSGIGINNAVFALDNQINACSYGLYNCNKYKDNVTLDCATPFFGGTSVGFNN